MKNQHLYKRGFTLIELLVVVLIIGVLASVALPQYQLAVAKARFQQAVILGTSIAQAERLYHTENGMYTTKWADLDISLPPGKSSTEKSVTYSWGSCSLNANDTVSCGINDAGLTFFGFYNEKTGHLCRAADGYPLARKICLQMGGVPITRGKNDKYEQFRLPMR